MKKAVAMLLAICMAVGLAGCGGGSEPGAGGGEGTTIEHPSSIVICASNSGNIWYSCAVKISELLMKEFPDMSVTVIEGGGDANIDVVNLGTDAQLGFTSSTSLVPAFAGENENVKDCSNVKALMSVQMSYAQTAVLASSDIHTFADQRFTALTDNAIQGARKAGFVMGGDHVYDECAAGRPRHERGGSGRRRLPDCLPQ